MGESEPGPDVFLSYASEDEARARELGTALDQRGFSVFWDRKVPPGQTWHSYIGDALANARCVVVAWSRHSITSQWVIEEASEGKDRNVLVPVLFETVPPPFGFRAIQAANLIAWHPDQSTPAFDGLVRAIQMIVDGQAGSGAGAEAELSAPPEPASSEPAPKTRPSVRPATPSPASSQLHGAPVTPPHGHGLAWSRRAILAMTIGFVAIAGAIGAAVLWRFTQPERITPSPMAEAEPSRREPGSPDPEARTEAAVAPAPGPSETPEAAEEMQDCAECPEMVLVPAGEFTMGSPPDEPRRDDGEGPQRKVTLAEPFWVGKYEVTFAEWDACVAAGGCSTKADNAGWGRDNRPVINISWHDAQEYVGWLTQTTGKTYRLLSEAEWEYASRAGSQTAFWWGDDVGRNNANCAGCGSEWDHTKTAPVGSFRSNNFGLRDTAGNVWEWVEDCRHDNYEGAPTDGSAWVDGDCSTRVARGGSWNNLPRNVGSANRDWDFPGLRVSNLGFRVARTGD